MRTRATRQLLATGAVTIMLAACSSNPSNSSATTRGPVELGPAVSDPFRETTFKDAACKLEQSTLFTALDSYNLLNGHEPPTMAVLLASHLLSQKPKLYGFVLKAGKPQLIPTAEGITFLCPVK